jgi:hypothetical protein
MEIAHFIFLYFYINVMLLSKFNKTKINILNKKSTCCYKKLLCPVTGNSYKVLCDRRYMRRLKVLVKDRGKGGKQSKSTWVIPSVWPWWCTLIIIEIVQVINFPPLPRSTWEPTVINLKLNLPLARFYSNLQLDLD